MESIMKSISRFTLSLVLVGLILSGTIVSAQDAQTDGSSAPPERGVINAGEVIAIRHLTLKKKTDPGEFEQYVKGAPGSSSDNFTDYVVIR